MKVLYIHDYRFRINNEKGIGFEVGMPISYFERFIKAGAKVVILSRVKNTNNGKFYSSKSIDISKFSSKSYFLVFFKMLIFFKVKKFDLYVINYPSIIGLFFLLFHSKKCCYILEHVNDDYSFISKPGGRIVSFFLKKYKKKFFTRAYGVTTVSDYLVNSYYPDNYLVASNVDVSIPNFIERRLGFPLRIISVGALSKKKGIDLALQRIKEINVPCEYYIAGGQGDVDLNKFTIGLPSNIKVIYLGMLEKDVLYKYLINSHVFIQPSRSEGLPRAVIEAMAYSLPCIVSTLPCFHNLIKSNYRIDWHKENSLRLALENLCLEDNYLEESHHNYTKSLYFDEKILSEKKINFYKEVCNELHAGGKV